MKRPVTGALVLALIAGVAIFWQGGAADSAPSGQPQAPTPYKCYQIAGLPPGVPPVELVTMYGVEPAVQVISPAFLCEPALKDGVGNLAATPYKAYLIADTHDPDAVVDLETQFGLEEEVAVGPAQFLWRPALKVIEGGPPEGDLSQTPYKCYAISDPPPVHPPVQLVTQFGVEEGIVVGPAQLLCEPARMNGIGDSTASPFKCYQIIDDAPQVPPVDLITEFPPEPEPIVEQGVVVGPPAFLCDPAVRSIVHDPVGGLAELPAIAGDDGGWSTWAYAALAGGLAAVIAAVTAGAWFARRRWVR